MSEYSQFQSVELSPSELLLLAKTSHEFFMEYFLGDEIQADDYIQDFHILVFSRFIDLAQELDVIALPRGHAKTTYLRLAFVYLIYFSDLEFMIYLSATHNAAAASLQVIWDYIVSAEGQELFGSPNQIIKLAHGEGWYEFVVTAYDEQLEPYKKHVILRALGQGQALRGMNLRKKRPQFAGVDDVEDETAVKTHEGYLKMKAWFDNTFMRALDRRKRKVAQIGNLIGSTTLLADNLNDPNWRSMRFGVLRADGTPLWPTLWSVDQIKRDIESAIRRGQLAEWMGEMMNVPANVEHGLIHPDHITYSQRRHPADGKSYYSFITIDPAISKQDSADHCAIVLHTIDSMGILQQSEYVHRKGMEPSEMADIVESMCTRWGTKVVGVESVQLQKLLLHYFEVAMPMRGLLDLEYVPIEVGRTHKVAKLSIYAAMLKDGSTTIPHGDWDITNQLLEFDKRFDNNQDDLIDGCSMCSPMLDQYMQLILSSTPTKRSHPRPKAQPESTAT